MKQLAEIFTIDIYFILKNNDDIFNVNRKNNTIIKAEGVEIDDYNAKFVSWCGIEDFVHVSICYPEIKKLVEKNYRPYIK